MTSPSSISLVHDVVLGDLRDAIAKDPALSLLLPALDRGKQRSNADQAQVTFSKMFQYIQQDPDLEKRYREDIPDNLKPHIEAYASSLKYATPSPGEIPELPISPLFRRYAEFIQRHVQPSPNVLEGDGKPMDYVPQTVFENWGKTIRNKPSETFIARTVIGLCNLVKWAKANNKKVRVAGYRHTWTDFYSEDGEVLVMLLPLKALTEIPSSEPTLEEIQKDSNLVGITVAPNTLGEADPSSTLCTIQAGTTNEMFRRWCLENRQWCLPFNVIMVEITLGGSNGPICHGSGFSTTTLSDLVAEYQYIDPNGDLQTISDPTELRAASGCFGILGICVALTLRLDAMSTAVMNPVKLPVPLAIPPPRGYKVPKAIDMKGITDAMLEQAREDFVKRCEDNYYLEWFWFPLTKEVWVNTWQKYDAGSTADLQAFPSAAAALWQWTQAWLAENLINSWAFQLLSGAHQALLLGATALSQMPDIPNPKDAERTLVSEAIHFRRGIQNMRVLDSEWEIPIPEAVGAPGKRDYEIVQRAWWDGLTAFYARPDVPMRVALEMRLTGGSSVILAPQRGNDLGTISIEVLTILTTKSKDWQSFLQQVADYWTSYRDKGNTGNLLNARPHWAKEWQGLTVRGKPIVDYFREVAYKDAIPEFRAALEGIAQARGTTISDMSDRFGNSLVESLFLAT